MLNLVGNLFVQNTPINLVAVNSTEKMRVGKLHLLDGYPCVDMQQHSFTYPEKPIYFESRLSKECRMRSHPRHDLLGSRIIGCSKSHPWWRNILRIRDLPCIADHKLIPHVVVPAVAYITMAVEAISQIHREAETSQKITLFKLHNVAIQSALHFTNDEDGVETVLNLERTTLANGGNNMSAWRRFTIS